jgi:ABC-type xylose transport system permease subunit
MSHYDLLVISGILLYAFAPVAITIFSYSSTGRKLGLPVIGTIFGFCPFILFAVSIYFNLEERTHKTIFDLDVFSYSILTVSFLVCFFLVLMFYDDPTEEKPNPLYSFWKAMILIIWLVLQLASTISFVLSTHSGPLM